jgi:hypothetical protein
VNSRVTSESFVEVEVADGAVGLRFQHLRRTVAAVAARHALHHPPDDRIRIERSEPELPTYAVHLFEQRRRGGS